MTLLLTNKDVEHLHRTKILTIDDYVQAVERAYREVGLGQGQLLPRESLWIPSDEKQPAAGNPNQHYVQPGKRGSLKILACALPASGVMGVLTYSGGFSGTLSGDQARMWLLLYNTKDGALMTVMEASHVIWMGTGATAAVAAKHLASRKATYNVGIIGTGRQAHTQLLGLSSVLNVKMVKVYSRTPERRQDFAGQMGKLLPAQVTAVDSAQEAIQNTDVIVTVTTAKQPVLAGEWLEAGVHINAIGAHYPDIREVDDETVRKSAIVVDSKAQALKEKGDLLIPIRNGTISPKSIRAELAEVVCGAKKGRVSDKEITLFCSGGTAIEYVSAGDLILRKARERNLGFRMG
jgi:ornithine cyclodeaminase/alanine dehydrogenase-like protein (mu-crystallin family)